MLRLQFLNFSGIEKNDITELTWTATEENLLQYEVESSTDSVNFEKKRVIPATNQPSENTYTFNDTIQGIPKIFYRLRIINNDGKWDYSKTITVVNDSSNDVKFELITFSGVLKNSIAEITWSATEQNLLQYELESSLDSVNFEKKGVVAATNQATGNTYNLNDTIQGIQKIFYRLNVVDGSGKSNYSTIITVVNDLSSDVKFDLITFSGVLKNSIAEITWSATEQNLLQYELESSLDSVNFEKKGVIAATNQATGNTYNLNDTIQGVEKIFYRLRVIDKSGKSNYSTIITVVNDSSNDVTFHLINFSGVTRNNIARLTWSATERNLQQYEVESSPDSINFQRKGIVVAKNQPTGNNYSFEENIQGIQKYFTDCV